MAIDPARPINQLPVPDRVLMGPGPSNVHPRVYSVLTTPVIGHLDPVYLGVMDDVQELLRYAFQTKNEHTFALQATGMAGMEAVFTNLVEAGDRVLVCVNGFFGARMCDIIDRLGGEAVRVEAEWGHAIDPAAVRKALGSERDIKAVALVHAETSTGVMQPIEEISSISREHDALLIIDCVTSLGGCVVEIDAWGVDAAYSGTQKCVGSPPGLSPVTFGPRAVEAVQKRRTRVPSFYYDLIELFKYWSEPRAYHHTGPVSMMYALREALRMLHEEGLPNRIARHQRNAALLIEQLGELGFEPFAQAEVRLPPLTAVVIPQGVEDAAVRRQLLQEYNLEIGGGLGPIAGKVWRIGLMGYTSHPRNVYYLRHALKKLLGR